MLVSRRILGWIGIVVILAGVLYFLGSFYTKYGDPVTVMEESLGLVVAGFVIRLFRGEENS